MLEKAEVSRSGSVKVGKTADSKMAVELQEAFVVEGLVLRIGSHICLQQDQEPATNGLLQTVDYERGLCSRV
jgi:hypothetical protein